MDRKNKALIMRQLIISLMNLKRTMLLLTTASLFAMFFSSSFFFFLLVKFVKDSISSKYPLLFHSFSVSVGRRSHAFLICNSILVILILCSSGSSPRPSQAEEDRDQEVGEKKWHIVDEGQGYDWQIMLLPDQLSGRMQDADKEEQKAEEFSHPFIQQQHEQLIRIEQGQVMHNLSVQSYSKSEQHSDTQSDDRLATIVEEEGATAGVVEDEWCSLSTDELNRRCEEFIKKIKQEIIKSEQGQLTSSSSATLVR